MANLRVQIADCRLQADAFALRGGPAGGNPQSAFHKRLSMAGALLAAYRKTGLATLIPLKDNFRESGVGAASRAVARAEAPRFPDRGGVPVYGHITSRQADM